MYVTIEYDGADEPITERDVTRFCVDDDEELLRVTYDDGSVTEFRGGRVVDCWESEDTVRQY